MATELDERLDAWTVREVRRSLQRHFLAQRNAGGDHHHRRAVRYAENDGYTTLAELCRVDPQAALAAVELLLEDA